MKHKLSILQKQHPEKVNLIGLILVLLITLSILVFQKTNSEGRIFFHLNFLALLSGLVYEYYRLVKKWPTVMWTALGAFVVSILMFLHGRSKHYSIAANFETWPYYFIGSFIMMVMVNHYKAITQKLTEGVTLLMTLSINYWIIANRYWEAAPTWMNVLLAIVGLFTLFSMISAFTNLKLGRGIRLSLSIWSSLIALALAADNFIQLMRYHDIENIQDNQQAMMIFFQFFLLGVSSIYIAQNLTMIVAYVPGKKYLQSVRDMNALHLERYSEEQVRTKDAVIVALISLLGYGLNFYYAFFPVNAMIWMMIALTPILLGLVNRIIFRKQSESQCGNVVM